MISKKICIVGALAVGKTSLVKRYVKGVFDEKYLTSVGVKVDKVNLKLTNKDLKLILWDIQGDDDLQQINPSHLRGAAGYFLVADGTRPKSILKAIEIKKFVEKHLTSAPFLFLVNKFDLPNWEINEEILKELTNQKWLIRKTSAKTGEGVKEAFEELAEHLQL